MAGILVVDDDESLGDNLKLVLEHRGFKVSLSYDGESACALIESQEFDALLLDWDLPDMDGLEICRRYRDGGGLAPVIMLTGRTNTDDKILGLRAGADDYMTKPFSSDELVARLEAQLRRTRRQAINGPLAGAEDLIGKVFIDKYLIESILGRGGMGIVYKGRHQIMARSVAIKILRPAAGQAVEKRFEQEARALSLLSHPGLVGIYDYGTWTDGSPYIVMEYLQGKTLSRMVDEAGRLSIAEALPIFMQICDALAHAHSQGVIHRDLKPDNIIVDSQDQAVTVKVVDLGLVKFTNPGQDLPQALTAAGQVFGSPYYMSPEQATGKKTIDQRSDIFSLGCLMYETLTGVVPLTGDTFVETIARRLAATAPKLSEACPDLQYPEQLDTIIGQAISSKREDRQQCMTQLKEQLMTCQIAAAEDTSMEATAEVTKDQPLSASTINKIFGFLFKKRSD